MSTPLPSPAPIEPDAIRSLRHARGWTQDELAERIGVDRATVSRLERGLVPVPKPICLLLEQILGQAA